MCSAGEPEGFGGQGSSRASLDQEDATRSEGSRIGRNGGRGLPHPGELFILDNIHKFTGPILLCRSLYPLHGEHGRVQQNGQIHKEVSVANVVEVVLNILVDQERTVGA